MCFIFEGAQLHFKMSLDNKNVEKQKCGETKNGFLGHWSVFFLFYGQGLTPTTH